MYWQVLAIGKGDRSAIQERHRSWSTARLVSQGCNRMYGLKGLIIIKFCFNTADVKRVVYLRTKTRVDVW